MTWGYRLMRVTEAPARLIVTEFDGLIPEALESLLVDHARGHAFNSL